MKRIISAIPLLILTILVGCSDTVEDTKENKEVRNLPLVKVAKVQSKTFIHKITIQGELQTDQDVLLNAEMGGQISNILVKEGQNVSKGQLLVSIDASVLTSNVEEIKSQLEYAKYMLGKQQELVNRGVGSELDLETAKNQVNSMEFKINSLNAQRGKSSIRAPFSGVIDQVFAKDGEVVGPQNPLIRLVNNSKIEVVADISEKHFAHIKAGTPVEITFPNYKDTSIMLKISSVGAYIEPTNRTFRIRAMIPNNKTFIPNMLVQLNITDMIRANAIVVPSMSVIKDHTNQNFVYLTLNEKKGEYALMKVRVRVIQSFEGESLVEGIDAKLTANEMVVVEGAKGVTEADNVRIK
ncbi:MAG: membrane fusion protein (multidrug efflux system) [Psychromonas sp.]|jgi:membrane fusion protein (multidrug efflux system)